MHALNIAKHGMIWYELHYDLQTVKSKKHAGTVEKTLLMRAVKKKGSSGCIVDTQI